MLIPDDNAEPRSFRFSWLLAKLLLVIGTVLALHIFGGGIAYWKYYRLSEENSELERSNNRLLEDNKRVYQLSAQLEEMSKEQSKILSLLGVDANAHGGDLALMLPASQPFVAARNSLQPPDISYDESIKELTPSGGFMIRRRVEHAKYPRNLPTMLPVEGFLTTEFTRSRYPLRSHPGIDIAAKRGSVVFAAGEGKVVFANWTYDLGNLIIIHHGDDVFSYYGHNERILVSEKAFVKKGEPIALLGSSGKSSGPHLHFEIWKDGVAIDPRQILLAFRASSK